MTVIDDTGHVSRVPETTRDTLAACADRQLPPLDFSGLAFVYDTEADALEVIRVRDGAPVCVPNRFTAGFTLGNASGAARIRQAIVIEGDNGRAVGSATGPVMQQFDRGALRATTAWKAKISGARYDPDSGVAEIFEGVFRTGAPLLPVTGQ
ncbi:MAG: hypothetical protein HY271_03725 [Deltaproteobacteria bacterium]|nr:hypothetical protein [Deltaproteobacteria bacterium]